MSKKRRKKQKKSKSASKPVEAKKPATEEVEEAEAEEARADDARADDDEADEADDARADDDEADDAEAEADDAEADDDEAHDDEADEAEAKARAKADDDKADEAKADDEVIVKETAKPKVKKAAGVTYDVTKARLLALIPGFHRFYLGRHVSGFLFLVTFGFFGLGTVIDIIMMKSLCESSSELEVEAVHLGPDLDDDDSSAVRTLKWIDHSVGLGETLFLIMCLMGLIGVASAQAVSMKVFNKSWAWSFDVIRYSVFFIAMAGASLAAQQERQISMDFVSHNVSPWWRARLRFFLRLFIILICIILYMGGMKLREAAGGAYELVPPKLGISALPVGALLIAFHMAMHNAIDLVYWRSGKEPPEQEQAAV